MNKEIKGYCVQKGKPNPNKPVDIEINVIGKNLFEPYETYEVNGRKYTDNLGHYAFINIPKEQYIEYEQLKEDFAVLKRLQMINNNILNELEEYLEQEIRFQKLYSGNWGIYEDIISKIYELKEKYK